MKKIASSLKILIAFVLLFGSLTMQASAGISLQQRIAYQRAIEEVYWKHTIWPMENPQPKPPLNAVVSGSAIRYKTQEYIRKSNALENYWNSAITAEQLQSELNRMAKATRNPALLQEIWNALHNDPYVIAECFVRPVLVNRVTDQIPGFEKIWQNLRAEQSSILQSSNHRYSLPKISPGNSNSKVASTDLWLHLWPTTGSPSARCCHVAVWTGTVMIIWSGYNYEQNLLFKTGAQYDPGADSWSATNSIQAPGSRFYATAVWTGSKMIVWGGRKDSDATATNTGGMYDPITNTWTPTSSTGAPIKRESHSAIWTGKEMIVWGGSDGFGGSNAFLKAGGRYNPSTNTWVGTADAPIGRRTHTAVWTGSEMIVWGGFTATNPPLSNTGHKYDPRTDSWSAISNLFAPSGRAYHTAVWTGKEMIIWGGLSYPSGEDVDITYYGTGGRYDSASDRWIRPPTLSGAPSARAGHTAIWTGSEMIIWGGSFSDTDGNNYGYDSYGGRFSPDSNSWTTTTITNCPGGRGSHTAVWTGNQMIIWGGYTQLLGSLDTGGRYYPWFYF